MSTRQRLLAALPAGTRVGPFEKDGLTLFPQMGARGYVEPGSDLVGFLQIEIPGRPLISHTVSVPATASGSEIEACWRAGYEAVFAELRERGLIAPEEPKRKKSK